jgi:hypothetical protein
MAGFQVAKFDNMENLPAAFVLSVMFSLLV